LTSRLFGYVVAIRGTPLLVSLMFAYYGLPSLGILLEAYTVGITVLAINHGAFITEIVRAGIESIERGQYLASHALGMSGRQTMMYIILPQAVKRILPPLTNESINLLKNSALASTIAVGELLRAGLEVMTWKANTFSPFFGVALIYLILTLPLVWLSHRLERRYAVLT
jgi:polar amino acid transport system permease protein